MHGHICVGAASLLLATASAFSITDMAGFLGDTCRAAGASRVLALVQPTGLLHREVQLVKAMSEARVAVQLITPGRRCELTGRHTLYVLVYNGAAEHRHFLLACSKQQQLGSRTRWLILASLELRRSLLDLLNHIGLRLDSNISVGIVSARNNVKLLEVYQVGVGAPLIVNPYGSWTDGKLHFLHLPFKYRRRGNMQGYLLQAVTVLVNKFYTQIEQRRDGSYVVTGGYFGNMFMNLRSILNFTYTLQYLDGYSYGSADKEQQEWTGLIGQLQRGEAELSACEVTIAGSRLDVIDFSTPIHQAARRLFLHRGAKLFRPEYYFLPYSMPAWVALAVAVPVLVLTRRLLVAVARHSLGWPARSRTAADIFVFVTLLLQQGADDPRRLPLRLLHVSAALLFLVVSIAYGAKLTATSTLGQNELPLKNLQQVLDSSNWKLTIVGGSFVSKTFEEADSASLEGQVWRRELRGHPARLLDSVADGLRKVLTHPRYVFMGQEDSCQQVLLDDFSPEQACQVGTLSNKYFEGGLGFGLRMHSQYKQLIDFTLLRLQEVGVTQRLARKWIPFQVECSANTYEPADWSDVLPLLLILTAGGAAATLLLLVELAVHALLP